MRVFREQHMPFPFSALFVSFRESWRTLHPSGCYPLWGPGIAVVQFPCRTVSRVSSLSPARLVPPCNFSHTRFPRSSCWNFLRDEFRAQGYALWPRCRLWWPVCSIIQKNYFFSRKTRLLHRKTRLYSTKILIIRAESKISTDIRDFSGKIVNIVIIQSQIVTY